MTGLFEPPVAPTGKFDASVLATITPQDIVRRLVQHEAERKRNPATAVIDLCTEGATLILGSRIASEAGIKKQALTAFLFYLARLGIVDNIRSGVFYVDPALLQRHAPITAVPAATATAMPSDLHGEQALQQRPTAAAAATVAAAAIYR
jgi:hypothetical protein